MDPVIMSYISFTVVRHDFGAPLSHKVMYNLSLFTF